MNDRGEGAIGAVSPPWAAFVAVALTQAAYCYVRGIVTGSDDVTFSNWAEILIASGFDYPTLFATLRRSPYPNTLYAIWVTLFALAKLAFGPFWKIAIVTLNIAASALTASLVARLAWRSTGSRGAGLLAAGLCCLSFDFFIWNRYLLSDPTYLPLAFGAFASLFLMQPRAARAIIAAIALGVLAAVYRPTGVSSLPILFLGCALVGAGPRVMNALSESPRRVGYGIAGLMAIILVGFLAFSYVMQDPSRWPFSAGRRLMDFTSAHFHRGEVVWERPNTFHAPPSTYMSFAMLTLDRFAHFFYIWNPDFSVAHKLGNLVLFSVIYGGSLRAFALALSARSTMTPGTRLLVGLSTAMAITIGAFHGMAQVDYDWRYRTPMMPHLILLASIGLGSWIRRPAAR